MKHSPANIDYKELSPKHTHTHTHTHTLTRNEVYLQEQRSCIKVMQSTAQLRFTDKLAGSKINDDDDDA